MKNRHRQHFFAIALTSTLWSCGNKKVNAPDPNIPSSDSLRESSGETAQKVADAESASVSQEDLLNGDIVLQKALDAIGGKDALFAIKSLEAKDCALEVSPMGLKGTSTSILKLPSYYKMVQDLGGVGQTVAGYNGELAWEMSSLTGSRIVEGEEKLTVVESADIHKDANWQKYYKSVKTTSIENVETKQAYKLVLARKNGQDVVRYYDKASFLLLKEEREDQTQLGLIKSEMGFEDYKAVSGVLMAHKVTVKAASATIVIDCSNIVANGIVAESEFALPDEIAKLKKK